MARRAFWFPTLPRWRERRKSLLPAVIETGVRGFSPSGRAGNYGAAGLWSHIDSQDASIAVIAMIEDREALADIDKIVHVEGLDAVFIGRGDLAVALGASSLTDSNLRAAVASIITAARARGQTCLHDGRASGRYP